MNSRTAWLWRTVLASGLILIFYGYICRYLRLYFFWESLYIGWPVFFLGISLWLWHRWKIKKYSLRHSIPELAGLVLIGSGLLFFILAVIVFRTSDAYHNGKALIRNNQQILAELGQIRDISLIPWGQVDLTAAFPETEKRASLRFILKGEKKYKDIQMELVKPPEREWMIEKYSLSPY